jgi:hypothetical protein
MYGNKNLCASGLVVKFSLAKAVPRVRFPASAFFCQSSIINASGLVSIRPFFLLRQCRGNPSALRNWVNK